MGETFSGPHLAYSLVSEADNTKRVTCKHGLESVVTIIMKNHMELGVARHQAKKNKESSLGGFHDNHELRSEIRSRVNRRR